MWTKELVGQAPMKFRGFWNWLGMRWIADTPKATENIAPPILNLEQKHLRAERRIERLSGLPYGSIGGGLQYTSRDEENDFLAEFMRLRIFSSARGVMLSYRDFQGEPSQRRVIPIELLGKVGEQDKAQFNCRYISAFCELRKAIRHFRLDRIIEVSDVESGEIWEIGAWVQSLYDAWLEAQHPKPLT